MKILFHRDFQLCSVLRPQGDQSKAIMRLAKGLNEGIKDQVLLGITGSGKTFTIANVIAMINRPVLILAPNKILAAQLYGEFKSLFPHNAVEYFVSYYDYYQPEAYLPATDTYIEKDSLINSQIDKMRHSATFSLLTRQDVILVASVSCIYGLGVPEVYKNYFLSLKKGNILTGQDELLRKLVEMFYLRSEFNFKRGTFRVRGELIDIFPIYEEDNIVRVCFFGNEIEKIVIMEALSGEILEEVLEVVIFPATHYITNQKIRNKAIMSIEEELFSRISFFESKKLFVEKDRVKIRTMADMEMMRELGWCHGIENYSRHLTGLQEGDPPPTLLDYFPENWFLVVDESHVSIPQIRGMYNGDRSRKKSLVDNGFRLPSALDNRPLNFEEFQSRINQAIYVSATPGEYELKKTKVVVEQVIRPTGLIDPLIEVRPVEFQVEDLFNELKKVSSLNERGLVVVLTKRMAEDLTGYFVERGLRVKYLHGDIKTIKRVSLLQELRTGVYDILVGVNLLREGLDLPEVSLVAVLDADSEGFLRNTRSLTQIAGRASRHIRGRVIFYAAQCSKSMLETMREMRRRRELQENFNKLHNIVPKGIKNKNFFKIEDETIDKNLKIIDESKLEYEDLKKAIVNMENKMREVAENLDFEKAILMRDKIRKLKFKLLEF